MGDIYHASPPPLRVDPTFAPRQWAIQTDAKGLITGIVVAPELESKARELFLAEPPPVDYKALLEKFVRHAETFIRAAGIEDAGPLDDEHRSMSEGLFADTEWAELQRLAGEAPR